MLRECDYSQALLEQVNQAISDKTPLVIQGSNSKIIDRVPAPTEVPKELATSLPPMLIQADTSPERS
ncbi:Glycolate oxidase subunit glcE [human gut metagenome]|uniref:Glycolate oxidase subunit glcE n=1 Tax=human gut metagenome TaxID=408170 RepID=W1YIQ3_9ZZZZ